LGLAYKPQSHVIERSQGLEAALAIADSGIRVVCYDPLARDAARDELKEKALVLDTVKACLNQAEIVVIANADPEFARLTSEDFPRRSPPLKSSTAGACCARSWKDPLTFATGPSG
jgi:UDP-glucose 6-dehydrogenase